MDMKKKNWKSILFNVLKVVVSAGMLAYVLIFRVDLRALGEAIAGARWGYLATAIVLAMGGVALRAVRWLALLRALDIDVPLRRLVKLYYVGTFFNSFMPSGFGGDAIRIVELARHSQKTPEAIGTVLVDRATGLWVLFLLGLLALPFARASLSLQMTVAVGAIALAVVVGGWVVTVETDCGPVVVVSLASVVAEEQLSKTTTAMVATAATRTMLRSSDHDQWPRTPGRA